MQNGWSIVKSVFSLSWSWLLIFKSDICTKVAILIIQIHFSGSIQNQGLCIIGISALANTDIVNPNESDEYICVSPA